MDETLIILLLVLLLALIVISPILAIIALVQVKNLRHRVADLRWCLDRLRRDVGDLKQGEPSRPPPRTPTPSPAPTEPQAPREEPPPLPSREERKLPAAAATSSELSLEPELMGETRATKSAVSTEPRPGMEERLGVRIPVWIGAIALTFAGVFLVKYTFDKGLLTPTTRVTLGAIFGAGLLLAGEVLRGRALYISQALSAAGVADLYACLLAAVNLYEIVNATVGSVLLVLVTAAAVLLSLRQGPIVATVGLVGGFLMPALIQTREPRPAALFGYLLLLEVGLVAVTGKRGWWWLATLTLVGSMIWAGLWIFGMLEGTFPPAHGLWVGLFLLLSIAAFVLSDGLTRRGVTLEGFPVAQVLAWGAMAAGLFLTAFLTRATGFSNLEWCFLGIISAGCMVLGRVDATKEGLAALAAVTGAVLLCVWHAEGVAETDNSRFAFITLALGVLHAGGGYACLWRARRPAFWAIVSSSSVVVYFLVAYWEIEGLTGLLSWGGISLLLASLTLLGAFPLGRWRTVVSQGDACLAAYAVATTTLLSLTVPLELEREWISVAWGLEVAALAWLEGRLHLRVLRYLAAVVAAAVGVRLLLNPAVLVYPIGESVVWNWLLYGYGVPVLAFAWAARAFRRLHDDVFVLSLEAGAVALGLALITLQVRQYFHPAYLNEPAFYLAEWASYSIGWLILGVLLLFGWKRLPRPSLLWGGALVGCAGLLLALAALGLGANPLWSRHPVGETPVLNTILYAYGLTGILGLLLARQLSRLHWRGTAVYAGISSLVLLLLLVSLEVRQAFQGTRLDGPAPSNAEWYAYSAAWIVFGTLVLIVGIATRGIVARYTSLLVMLGAVLKVFLFDTRELQDLYRVLSFLGLGLSLLLLAFLYQRFVFRRLDA